MAANGSEPIDFELVFRYLPFPGLTKNPQRESKQGQMTDSTIAKTWSYKDNFSVNLRYAEIQAQLSAD